MALFHRATLTPSKAELLSGWAPTQPWGPAADDPVSLIGSFRFDDPDGRVGMETHLLQSGRGVTQVPVTYRDGPLDGAEDALIGLIEHSVLGTRWVYDGVRDPRFVLMLAAVALTGQGEAIGLAREGGRWFVSPSTVRISGGGWGGGIAVVDGFELRSDTADGTRLVNDQFELTLFRRPGAAPPPRIGLTATWPGQPEPVVLAEIDER